MNINISLLHIKLCNVLVIHNKAKIYEDQMNCQLCLTSIFGTELKKKLDQNVKKSEEKWLKCSKKNRRLEIKYS